ncbi:MAG: GNAT family N-acetyltransferase [Myxococcales bacterium]|nr:GNAT family N-acetyltransferase [Myxococcales bacterium]
MPVRMAILELRQATLRPWRASDAAALVPHANSRAVWRNVRDRFPYPYTPADAEAWVAFASSQTPTQTFAVDVGGEAVGGIGIGIGDDVHRRSAEIGYWLGERFWGRGIATEAVVAVSAWAFANFDLCRLYALVFEWNQASCRVLEKAGYAREGLLRRSVHKDGQTIDAFLSALVRAD